MIAEDTLEFWSYDKFWDVLSGPTYDQFCNHSVLEKYVYSAPVGIVFSNTYGLSWWLSGKG